MAPVMAMLALGVFLTTGFDAGDASKPIHPSQLKCAAPIARRWELTSAANRSILPIV